MYIPAGRCVSQVLVSTTSNLPTPLTGVTFGVAVHFQQQDRVTNEYFQEKLLYSVVLASGILRKYHISKTTSDTKRELLDTP